MRKRINIVLKGTLVLFTLLWYNQLVKAQALTKISTSSAYERYAEEGLYTIYNWEFEKAEDIANYFKKYHPSHPTGFFLEAMSIYWENYPFEEDSEQYNKHMELLEKATDLADDILEKDENNEDAILFQLMSKAVMMRNYDRFGRSMKAVGAAKDMYKLVLQCIELKDRYVEFYFPSGIYNYYREYYPDQHPVYKPFMIFFKSGDKELGLQELEIASKKAIFTNPESLEYLADIYFHNENKKQKGLELYRQLHQKFPGNKLYLLDFLSVLNKAEKYHEMDALLKANSWKHLNNFYKAGFETYHGIVLQWKDADSTKAKQAFESALYYNKDVNSEGNRFYFYIYDGLAKYWKSMGNSEYDEKYSKLAKKYN
ncbi:MAG: hypothetical protein CMO01_20680 [Thalassobius sp.]|nr:hypothetical protein [Thalassovita sp.]